MEYAFETFERRKDWPLVDVTAKSIEETAVEVLSLLGRYFKHAEEL
jgi:regulator of PEP synthase PpsR (kinase-PPPase family)